MSQGSPKRVHELNPEAPAELAAICEKTMAREKSERYRSSLELAEDLQAYLDHRVVRAYRTGAAVELRAWVARNRATAAATAAAILFFVAGLSAVVFVQNRRNVEVTGALDMAETARSTAEMERDSARRHLYRALLREARAIRLTRSSGYRSEAWDRIRQARALDTPERDLEELRQEAVASMGDFVGMEPVLDLKVRWCQGFAIDPRGARLALGLRDGTVSIRTLPAGDEAARLGEEGKVAEGAVSWLYFGADGDRLLVAHDGGAVRERLADRLQDRKREALWEAERVVELIPRGSDWRYSDTGENLGEVWRQPRAAQSLPLLRQARGLQPGPPDSRRAPTPSTWLRSSPRARVASRRASR